MIALLSNSEQLTWINEQYKPLLIKAFAFQKGEVIFLTLLSSGGASQTKALLCKFLYIFHHLYDR